MRAGSPRVGPHRVGIISNPRSRAHLDGQAGHGSAAGRLPRAAPESREALRDALAGFADEGVDLLVVAEATNPALLGGSAADGRLVLDIRMVHGARGWTIDRAQLR